MEIAQMIKIFKYNTKSYFHKDFSSQIVIIFFKHK